MLTSKKLFLRLTAPMLVAGLCALPTLAQDCGEAPEPPELVDGSEATMEDLAGNSEMVKSYIANADEYLDCRESYLETEAFRKLPPAERSDYIDENREVLSTRNSIGEDFNAEVVKYKEANS